jgi:GNAT superfamily N-acetyltransferase
MDLVVKRLGPDNTGDFLALMARDEEEGAKCWCMAWWTDTWEEWTASTPEGNRAAREALLADGVYDGYLAYLSGAPVAWLSTLLRDRRPKVPETFELDPDPSVWAITCFLVLEEARGQGVSREFLRQVLADLTSRGVTAVEGYPRNATGLDAVDLWSGPESLYVEAGFTEVQQGPNRSVYRLG